MNKNVKPVPEGYHNVTPYMIIKNAGNALAFYQKAFGAQVLFQVADPSSKDKIGHAEIKIGDSIIMIADEYPDMGYRSAETMGGTPVSLHVYVTDVDAFFKQAVASGAKVLRPVEDKFYSDRSGSLEDPFKHVWHIATHKEDLTLKEVETRAKKTCG